MFRIGRRFLSSNSKIDDISSVAFSAAPPPPPPPGIEHRIKTIEIFSKFTFFMSILTSLGVSTNSLKIDRILDNK